MKKIIVFISLSIFFTNLTSAQDAKFGGPFATLSFNKYGPSLSAGGGGTFLTHNNFYIGIFGQGTTNAFKREVAKDGENYLLKSKQTGFWFGYKHKTKLNPKLSFSIYNKVGFGSVSMDNIEKSIKFYDATIVFTPNLELAYKFTSFFELGLATYYDFFTRVNMNNYSNKDFNSVGLSLLFKFKGEN